jgi:hypothetical protein
MKKFLHDVFWSEKPIERFLLVCMGIAIVLTILIKAGIIAFFITE